MSTSRSRFIQIVVSCAIGSAVVIVTCVPQAAVAKTPLQENQRSLVAQALNNNETKVLRNIPYVIPSDGVRVGDVYLPPANGKLRPAVLLIHAGAWVTGDKGEVSGDAEELARNGFVVFNVNYRLIWKGGEFPADLIDTKDALAFLASKARQWYIDTTKLAAVGYSAGGHLAMLLAYTPDNLYPPQHNMGSHARPSAVVSWYGPTDVRLFTPDQNLSQYLSKAGPNAGKSASPICYSHTGVPTLFVHGTADDLVDISHSLKMQAALKAERIRAEVLALPGEGHGFTPSGWISGMKKIIQFLHSQFGI